MTVTKKRKTKRRRQHRPSYYLTQLPEAQSAREVLDLLSDAAHQPKRLVTDEDYERIYWQAHSLLNRKGGTE